MDPDKQDGILYVDQTDVQERTAQIARHIAAWFNPGKESDKVLLYGIPRGGVAVAYAVLGWLSKLGVKSMVVDDPEDATVFVDDVVDSGSTRRKIWETYGAHRPFFSLYNKVDKWADNYTDPHTWVHFPWEGTTPVGSSEDIVIRLLQFIGEDPKREGLKETPDRVLRAWKFWTKGYSEDPIQILKAFVDGAPPHSEEAQDEFVIVKNIPIFSMCEHHLAPFFGSASIGYIPDGKIVGLSKLGRLADIYARRLQVQERLTNQIANSLMEVLSPLGVGVVVKCRHLCMESRGVRHIGCMTTTSALRGAVKANPETRAEFFKLIEED